MKKTFKTILVLLLALSMVLSLAACGSKDDETPDGKKPNKKEEETPEFAYKTDFKEIYKSKNPMQPALITDDGFYGVTNEVVGKEIPEGAVEEYEGQYDIREPRICFVSNDGTVTRLENYVPAAVDVDKEGKQQFYSGTGIEKLFRSSDGSLVAVESTYANWYEGNQDPMAPDFNDYENYRNENHTYFRTLDNTGAEISCAEAAAGPDDGENSYVQMYSALMDDSGNIIAGTDKGLRIYSTDGGIVSDISSGGFQLDSLIQLGDGRIAAMGYEDGAGQTLRVVDIAAGSFGESLPLPYDAWNLFGSKGGYDLCYSDGASLYGYTLADQKVDKIVSWINCDVKGDNLSSISVGEDGTVTAYSSEYSKDGEEVTLTRITINKVPYDSVPHKQTLRLATMYTDYILRDMVIDFNRSHDDVRIEVDDYSEYDRMEAINDPQSGPTMTADGAAESKGYTKFMTEIMAGNTPDIMALGSLPYRQLAAKGILADLYPLMDADGELKREDFFPNVLKALETDGKLCSICTSFGVQTVIGASSVVGDTPGWTYEDYEAALAGMPEGCTGFDIYSTKEDMLNSALAYEMENLVDWSTGECHFNTPEFISLLEFANGFAAKFDWENHEWGPEDEAGYRISNGLQMLQRTGIWSVQELFYSETGDLFGGDYTYIGFPTTSGVGNALSLNNIYAIGSSCENKEAAWEFLREMLIPDAQREIYGIPINKTVYDEQMKEATTIQYEKDENGNYLLDPEGEKIPVARGFKYNEETGESIPAYVISQELADRVDELVCGTERVMDFSDSIYSIVIEEAQAYFQGQKSAEEVAKLIQSKASIYVNEQR